MSDLPPPPSWRPPPPPSWSPPPPPQLPPPPPPPVVRRSRAPWVAAGVVSLLVVAAVVVVGLVVRAGDDGGTDDPSAGRSDSVTRAGYESALSQVKSLVTISEDFEARRQELVTANGEPPGSAGPIAAGQAYQEARTAYRDTVSAIGESPALADPAVAAAFAAFEPQATGTIALGDAQTELAEASTVCNAALTTDRPEGQGILEFTRSQSSRCRTAVVPLVQAPFPAVQSWGGAWDTFMATRVRLLTEYDARLGGGAGRFERQSARATRVLVRALDAFDDQGGFAPVVEQVSVTSTYPPLLRLLEDRVDRD